MEKQTGLMDAIAEIFKRPRPLSEPEVIRISPMREELIKNINKHVEKYPLGTEDFKYQISQLKWMKYDTLKYWHLQIMKAG